MYSELRLLMIKRRVTIEAISKILSINRNTVAKKLNGKAKFTFEEFIKIRNVFFPDITLDALSSKE